MFDTMENGKKQTSLELYDKRCLEGLVCTEGILAVQVRLAIF